jgi:hypothetical protein
MTDNEERRKAHMESVKETARLFSARKGNNNKIEEAKAKFITNEQKREEAQRRRANQIIKSKQDLS